MEVTSYTTNHNSNYYIRSAYRGNTNAMNSDYRGTQPASLILSADAKAVSRMTEKLRALEYDSDHGTEVLENARAFVKTYNNLLESSEETDSSDVSALKKKMTKLLKNHKKELSSIGISLKSDGTLELDEDTFGEARPARIQEILSSEGTLSSSLRSIVKKIYRTAGQLPAYDSTGKMTEEESGGTVDVSL